MVFSLLYKKEIDWFAWKFYQIHGVCIFDFFCSVYLPVFVFVFILFVCILSSHAYNKWFDNVRNFVCSGLVGVSMMSYWNWFNCSAVNLVNAFIFRLSKFNSVSCDWAKYFFTLIIAHSYAPNWIFLKFAHIHHFLHSLDVIYEYIGRRIVRIYFSWICKSMKFIPKINFVWHVLNEMALNFTFGWLVLHIHNYLYGSSRCHLCPWNFFVYHILVIIQLKVTFHCSN